MEVAAFSYTNGNTKTTQKAGGCKTRCVYGILIAAVCVAWCLSIGGIVLTIFQTQDLRQEISDLQEQVKKCKQVNFTTVNKFQRSSDCLRPIFSSL